MATSPSRSPDPGEIETTDDAWAVALRTAMDLALNVAAIRQRYERTDPQASGARPGNEGRRAERSRRGRAMTANQLRPADDR